jgi:DNA-binding transcriptional regulator LsrR (DeoR family)
MTMPTQREIANHLDMSERNARDVLKGRHQRLAVRQPE